MKRLLTCLLLWLTTFSLWAQYNPTNPPEPGQYYTLTLRVTPSGGGTLNLSTTTTLQGGNFVRLQASAATGFRFAAWAENGVIISQDAQFDYQMPDRDVTLTAHFDYSPSNPGEPSVPDIPLYSRVYASCEPSNGGSFSGVTSGNKYVQGSSISLSTSAATNFKFAYWTEDGEVISTASSFKYVVKTFDTHLVAHFTYNPSNPAEPPVLLPTHQLYISASPSAGGSFSPVSGNSYQPGTAVSLKATTNSGYTFTYWTENDSIISTAASFTYTMPDHDVALQAHFKANAYNPSNPAEPGAPTGERHNIFGMTENALRGETIIYPVWLENSTSVMNMYIDLTFPDGFEVDTANARLSSRVGNHWLEKILVEDNTWRMRIRGQDVLIGGNGPVIEIPVAVPENALMGHNYLVALTHGVVMRPDSTQVPIGVRSGNIYVQRLYEDDLFASFSYDKYQTRVGFRNRSAGRIQSMQWDFGDGTTSTDRNPLHVYASPGTYTVRLTIQGESEMDIMETTIVLNEQIAWKAEGSFSIDTTLVSARNFSSMEELVTTLLRAEATGNVVVNILSGLSLDYDLSPQGLSNLITLYNKIHQAGYTITFRQTGTGHAPVLNLGTPAQHSKTAMQQFWETLNAVSWQNIETHLYGVWFDFAEWKALQRQIVSLGDKTKVIDFTRIAPALSYSWQQTPKSEVVFGAPEQGTKSLPAMMLTNEGEGTNDLQFAVEGSYNGQPFCNFTHTVTVAPALVGLFNDLTPADNALLDVTSFTISWNRILNAQYDLYLWDSLNPPPSQPVLHNTEDLHYASSGFCQFGHSYKWVVVATNGAQRVVSDTMSFSIRSLPDLHVTSVHCTEAEAEGKLTVSWSVQNDGKGHTGAQRWTDRIWLMMDVYSGTALPEFKPTLLAETENIKALDSGENYSRTMEVSLPKNMYGDVYIVVTADMYNLQNIEWSSIGGSVITPYQPTASGSGYRYLYAKTNASYNKVYEEDETPTRSDNFFYTKLQLDMPPVPDLQISTITAEPLVLSEYMQDENCYDIMADFTPTPLTYTGLANVKEWYSGKRFKVVATIVNRGTAPITNRTWRNGLWMANSTDRENADMILLSTQILSRRTLQPDDSVKITFFANLPYEWYGNTVFHVMADMDNSIDEFANTQNNWWQTDTITVLPTPGADFEPSNLQVPDQLVAGQDFEIKYTVQNKGTGIPFSGQWKDKIWISPSPDGIDNRATCIATFSRVGTFQFAASAGRPSLVKAELYHYEGDNYSVSQTIQAGNIPSDKYYIYVQVDAENKVDEKEEGETNNIIRSDSIRLVEPDLSVSHFSLSRDTVTMGDQVALTWTLQNRGAADLINAPLSDNLYATINQDGSDAVLITTLSNDVSIPSGEEKTLRANITIPQKKQLNGIRYFFLEANANRKIRESNTSNNQSSLVKAVCIYTEEERVPPVSGPAIAISDINTPVRLYTDSTGVVIFRLSNIGDKRIETEVAKELFLSTSTSFNISNAIPLQLTSIEGSTIDLRPGASVMITLRFRVPADVLSGNYFIHILCDRTNSIKSKQTSKNKAYRSVVVHGKLPDPVLENIIVPDTIYTSESTNIHFSWRNRGTWVNESFNTNIYISKSAKYDRFDKTNVVLATLKTPKMLPDEIKVYNYAVNIEDKLAGKWYLHIVPDWNERLFLSDSAKTFAKAIIVELSPAPDILLTSLQTPSEWRAGEQVEITYSVQNISDIATRQSRWADDFWLSPSSKLDTKNATKLGARTHSGTLFANQSYEATISYPIPAELQGNYILYVRTDAADAIVETDEDNNLKAMPVYINGANDRPADLVVSNLSVPDVIYAGEPVSITYTITNQGEFEAEGNLRDILYLSLDNQWDTGDYLVGVVSGDVRLEPGEQITRTATGVVTGAVTGAYYPILRTNTTRTIAERAYQNNLAVASPLQMDFRTLGIGSEVEINTSSYLKLTVQDARQNIVLRLSHPMGKHAGLYVSGGNVPSTARNGWHSAKLQTNQQEVVLSNLQAGTYYVLAQDNDAVMSSDEYVFSLTGYTPPQGASMTLKAELVDFGATSLDLTQGGNGGWVTTGINGALFDSIMDFRLMSANRILPAEVVTWEGGAKATVTFNLTEAEEGTYHLVSERPDGLKGTLESAFEVVEGRAFGLNVDLDFPSFLRPETRYIPFTFSYANGGTTDVELSEIRLVIDNGVVGLSVEDLLTNPQETLIYKPHPETNARGYVSIPPGEQEIINVYCIPLAGNIITVTVFILK